MLFEVLVAGAALVAGQNLGQSVLVQPGQISGINNPAPSLGQINDPEARYSPDPLERRELRLARMNELLAANPDLLERWNAMDSRSERIAFIRELDRTTPRSRGVSR